MNQNTWLNVAPVLGFILVGGVFAGTEITRVHVERPAGDDDHGIGRHRGDRLTG